MQSKGEYYAIMNIATGDLLRKYNSDSTKQYKGEHVLRCTNIDENTPKKALEDTMPRLFNCKDKAKRCPQRYCAGVWAYKGDLHNLQSSDRRALKPYFFKPVKGTERNPEDFEIVKVNIVL